MELFVDVAWVLFGYMSLGYVLALMLKRNDIVDIMWGLGYGVVALYCAYFVDTLQVRQIVVMSFVLIWAFRLAGHIYLRNRGKSEDFRYKNWRESWGKWFYVRSFFQIFMLQGFLLFVIASTITATFYVTKNSLSFLDYIGIVVWGFGFFFEAVGDYQLTQFKKGGKNKGKIMTSGLWKYTRHPNYFGEVTLWWGIFFLALSATGWWWLIISPITITFFILKVSGIPMLEKKYEGDPEFEEYKKKTNAFFPWFPKN